MSVHMVMSGRAVVIATRNPPFVGRLRELEALNAVVARALSGEPQFVLLQGEAGIGKTRLLREAADAAAAKGVLVVHTRCQEDLAVSLHPFTESLLPALERLPQWDASVLDRGQPAPGSDGNEGMEAARLGLHRALSGGVLQLARGQPLLLTIDDLQWADGASLDLLEHLVFSLVTEASRAKVAVAIFAAHRRPDPVSPVARALGRLRREAICTRIDLRRLGRVEVDAIARGLGVEDPTPELVDWLYRASDGNAFMVVELATALGRHRSARDRADPGEALPLPRELTAPAIARLETVSLSCRSLLATAAVLGHRTSLVLLSMVSGLGEDEVLALAAEAEDAGLGFLTGDTFEFDHPLLRTALYRRQASLGRRKLHALAAARLEEIWGDEAAAHAAEIAHHLIEARDQAPAGALARCARRAGDIARASLAWADAVRFYRAAMARPALEHMTPAEQADLYYSCGYVLQNENDLAAAREMYEQAIGLYQGLDSTPDLARTLVQKLNLEIRPGGTIAPDVRPLEELLSGLLDDDPLVGPVCAQLADAYLFTGNRPTARERAERAARSAARSGDAKSGMLANVSLGLLSLQEMDVGASSSYYGEALRLAGMGPDAYQRTVPLQRAPLALFAQGRLEEAEALAREGLERGVEAGSHGGAALAAATLAAIATVRGDFQTAERLCAEGLHLVQRSGYQWALAPLASALIAARIACGAAPLAKEALDTILPGARGWLATRSLIEAHESLGAGSKAGLEERLGLRWRGDMEDLANLCAAVEALDLAGRLSPDARMYEDLKKAVDGGVCFTLNIPFLVPRIVGLLASNAGLDAEARAYFTQAVETGEATGARLELAHSHLDFARMLARDASQAGEAAEHLRAALTLLSELGAKGLLRSAQRLAEQLKLDTPEIETRDGDALTYHEEAVLESYAAGRGEEAIAGSLSLTPATVRSTLETARSKAGVIDVEQTAAFLAASPGVTSRRRAAAVILFTDVVESVQLTERLGDEAAHEMVRRLHEALRGAIIDNHGEVMLGVLLGDGLLATFAAASQALAAALEIKRRAETQGVSLHIGLHAGDIIREGDVISGGAVNIAARIRDACPPGGILASATVRDLASTSSMVVFEDEGLQTLRGVAEPRRLFSVRPASARPSAYPDRLSEREVEVLRLIAGGRSNQQIADELVISLNTVLRHVSNIYTKISAGNRADAVSYAHRHGLAG